MTTVLGGLAGTSTAVGPGGSLTGLVITGGNTITIAPSVTNPAFSMPRDGVLTGISAYFSNTLALTLVSSSIQITGQVFVSATPNNIFTAVTGATVTLTPSLTGVGIGTSSNGITTGLNIPITAQSRVILVFTANVVAGIDVATLITGNISAGLNIQ